MALGALGGCAGPSTEPAPAADASAGVADRTLGSARASDAGSHAATVAPDAGQPDVSAPDAGVAGQAADRSAPCPPDMVLVAGQYCPGVAHKCIDHHDEYDRAMERRERRRQAGEEVSVRMNESERCLRYAEPAVCVSKKRRPMRLCMDRYEWPNRKGELPPTLHTWHDAVAKCKGVGKRLCTADEFNFACEGEQMLPYPYGFARDASKCNIDRPYIKREKNPKRWDACQADPECKAEFDRLDQRVPAGSMPGCVSPFGVYDLTGNVNEWVTRPGEEPPHRSGLKGGWWGPVRCRCRPMTTFHPEEDWGYEAGFRCCADAQAAPAM